MVATHIVCILLAIVHVSLAASEFSVRLTHGPDHTKSELVTFCVKYTGSKPVNVLTWGTPLEDYISGPIADIKFGAETVEYEGIVAKRSLKQVSAKSIKQFKPDQEVCSDVNLKQSYRFLKAIVYTAKASFPILELEDEVSSTQGSSQTSRSSTRKIKTIHKAEGQDSLEIAILSTNKDLTDKNGHAFPARHFGPPVFLENNLPDRHAKPYVVHPECASHGAPYSNIDADADKAIRWLARAKAWAAKTHHTDKDNSLMDTWQKSHYVADYGRVKEMVSNAHEKIAGSTFGIEYFALKIDCMPEACSEGTFAFIYLISAPLSSLYRTIYLCSAYKTSASADGAPDTDDFPGTDARAGVLIHELTHFENVGATTDNNGLYGPHGCSQADKAKAITNADNYEYLVERGVKEKLFD